MVPVMLTLTLSLAFKAIKRWLAIWCLGCCLIAVGIVLSPVRAIADAADDAAALIAERQADIEALAKTAPTPETIPGYVGTSVPQTGYTPTQLADPTMRATDNASQNAADAMTALPDQPELDQTKYSNAINVMDDPKAHFDLDGLLSGQYADCDPHQMTAPSTSNEQRCDAWRTRATSTCQLNRRIDVEANVRYRCDEDSTRIHKTCHRTLTKVCGQAGVCDTAGLRLESLQSDYGASVQGNGLILIGKVGIRTWCGDFCSTRDRNVRFEINNVGAVQTFQIVNGGFDDWIHIKLNGHVVWVGHGDRNRGDISVQTHNHTVRRFGCYAGRCGRDGTGSYGWYNATVRWPRVYQGNHILGSCERGTHWPIPQIDLKPYLREGQNHLEVRIISSGCGDGYFRIRAQSSCCNSWRESWVETC